MGSIARPLEEVMRVLILANSDMGLYKFRKELPEQLIADGHEVYVSVPDGDFVIDIKKMGCKVAATDISRHGTNPAEDLKLMKKYRRYIKKVQPDVVFTYTIKPNVYGGMVSASLGVPYVPNITGLGTAIENKGILQIVTLNLYRYAMRKAQTVFFQNTANEEYFKSKKIAVGKHKMLPGSGVNLSYYKALEYPKTDTIDFVFVARIMKEKGVDQYLDAAKAIRMKYPQTRFHICGFCEDSYEDEIRKLENKGIIIYHGLVKDMREIYKTVHCTVHPTYYPEGLSNVLLESAASGRPIITTNRPGCREVIEDGVNGYLVKEQDSKDLIEKVEKFIKLSYEEKKQMGLAGRAKVEKEFDRQIVVEAYMREIEIVNGGGTNG